MVSYVTINVRPQTREKLAEFAERRRLSRVEAIDVAVDGLLLLTREQLDALIERRPVGERHREEAVREA